MKNCESILMRELASCLIKENELYSISLGIKIKEIEGFSQCGICHKQIPKFNNYTGRITKVCEIDDVLKDKYYIKKYDFGKRLVSSSILLSGANVCNYCGNSFRYTEKKLYDMSNKSKSLYYDKKLTMQGCELRVLDFESDSPSFFHVKHENLKVPNSSQLFSGYAYEYDRVLENQANKDINDLCISYAKLEFITNRLDYSFKILEFTINKRINKTKKEIKKQQKRNKKNENN